MSKQTHLPKEFYATKEFYAKLNPEQKEFFRRLASAMIKDPSGQILAAMTREGSELCQICDRWDRLALAGWLRRNAIRVVK